MAEEIIGYRITENFRKVFVYYSTFMSSLITKENMVDFRFATISKAKLFMYIFARFPIVSTCIHNILLLSGVYTYKFGPLDIFARLEAALWAFGYAMYFVSDPLILQAGFHIEVYRFANHCDRIWDTAKKVLTKHTVNKLTHRLSKNWKRIFIHNNATDYFLMVNFAWQLWGGGVTYQSYPYSLYPNKNLIAETIAWFLQSFGLCAYCFVWSFLLTFHGIFAYYAEICIQAMSEALNTGRYSMEKTLQDYRYLVLASRLVGKHACLLQMVMYLITGIQQTVESYIFFQMIRLGAGGTDLTFLLLDLSFCLSRVGHSFYAIASVDRSVKELWRRIKQDLWSAVLNSGRRKWLRQTFRSLPPMKMRIGPLTCKQDLFLTGISVYMNYYIAAALWK